MSGKRVFSTTSRSELSSSFFSPQGKVLKEIHAILTETLACFLPGQAKDLSSPLYNCLEHGMIPKSRGCNTIPQSYGQQNNPTVLWTTNNLTFLSKETENKQAAILSGNH